MLPPKGLALVALIVVGLAVVEAQWPCGPRTTTYAFGDPHIYSYDNPGVISHCRGCGWHTYLANKYFHLEGYGSNPFPWWDSGYQWLTKVRLTFINHGHQWPITYTSEACNPMRKFKVGCNYMSYVPGEVWLIQIGNCVLIVDLNSWTIFRFCAWNNVYSFYVNACNSLYGTSCGILKSGCDSNGVVIGKRKKRAIDMFKKATDPCHETCKQLDEMYYDACMIDCGSVRDDAAGREGLGEMMANIPKMLEAVKADEKYLRRGRGGDGEKDTAGPQGEA